MLSAPYVITDADGVILVRFYNEQGRNDALMSGDFPDDAEPAYINEFPEN